MKLFLRIMMFLSLGMLVFNVTQVDWQSPATGQSTIALIGIFASASAFILLIILSISLKIKAKQKAQ